MLSTAVVKRAEKAGLNLIETGGMVQALQGTKVIAFHSSDSKALQKAMERLEEDRLRNLDKLPEDREPVLVSRRPVEAVPVPPEALIDATIQATAEAVPVSPVEIAGARIDEVIRQTIIKGSIVKSKYKDRYKKTGYSCGDEIAEELRAYVTVLKDGRARVDLARLKEVATTNGVWSDRYAQLNPGQQRMNIGNRIRAAYKEGKEIDIGGAILVMEFK